MVAFQFIGAHDSGAVELTPALDHFADCDRAANRDAFVREQRGLCEDEPHELGEELQPLSNAGFLERRCDPIKSEKLTYSSSGKAFSLSCNGRDATCP